LKRSHATTKKPGALSFPANTLSYSKPAALVLLYMALNCPFHCSLTVAGLSYARQCSSHLSDKYGIVNERLFIELPLLSSSSQHKQNRN